MTDLVGYGFEKLICAEALGPHPCKYLLAGLDPLGIEPVAAKPGGEGRIWLGGMLSDQRKIARVNGWYPVLVKQAPVLQFGNCSQIEVVSTSACQRDGFINIQFH